MVIQKRFSVYAKNWNEAYSLRSLVPKDMVKDVANSLAAMIERLWLRGALSEEPIDGLQAAALCKRTVRALI